MCDFPTSSTSSFVQMHPKLSQSSLLFSFIPFLLSRHFPCSLCLDDFQYSNCTSSFECGHKLGKIKYPFWVDGHQPDYCGHPLFKLHCEKDEYGDEYATIEMKSQKSQKYEVPPAYKVLHIDHNSRILKISTDASPMGQIFCPQSPFMNSTFFNYTSNVDMVAFTLAYGCSSVDDIPESYNFSCTVADKVHKAYLAKNISVANELGSSCESRVVIPDFPVLALELEGLRNGTSDDVVEVLREGFEVQWTADDAICEECVRSGGTCGYNTWSNQSCCFCRDKPYPNKCSKPESLMRKVPIAIAIAGGGVLLVCFLLMCCCCRRNFSKYKLASIMIKRSDGDENIEAIVKNYGSLAPQRYSYSDVKKMTDSFRSKLGQGGFGSVYRGKLPDGRLVAVKLLNISKEKGEEFINEVASISRTSHVNIVRLWGFCYESGKRALIYEFMCNGSLEKFIYGEHPLRSWQHLAWEKLYQIAIGIAQGLEYLHCRCNTQILHFDVKPHNILLDEDFCPKISDFGLAKLCHRKDGVVSMWDARGTMGYVAPEVFNRNFGQVSNKSDVYSYGMMILEMVGGRKNINAAASRTSKIYFPHWVYKRLELAEDHLGLEGTVSKEENEIARKMILVGLWCIQTDPSHRPSMSKVIDMLEGSLEALQIPPKPFLSSPPRSPADSSISALIDI